MINVEEELRKIYLKLNGGDLYFRPYADKFKVLARRLAKERDEILEYAIKTARELVAEQDGMDLGSKETRRLILETIFGEQGRVL